MQIALKMLESEAISIMREVAARCENPVILYSLGKDSSVLLHIARKAFFPAKIPFPLLHVDTGWKFRAMYEFREKIKNKHDLNLIIHMNPEAEKLGINPFDHGSLHTDMWKTQGLRQALDIYEFDAAIGGARRDEEKSRAKERVFSFRNKNHFWDVKNQRPELWSLYNTNKNKGESFRVFPLSNWTELDIWQYIKEENIEIVPLYYAKNRNVVIRDEAIFMLDDNRFPLLENEKIYNKKIRFRTLGCYPLTCAIESDAETIDDIIAEIKNTKLSERAGRKIDKEAGANMEQKKQEGYF